MDLVWRDRPSGLCPFDKICEVRDQIDGPFDAAMAQPGREKTVLPMLGDEFGDTGLIGFG